MPSTIKCEVSNTSALLSIALESGTNRVPSIFLDENVLERPPFEFFHEVVKFMAKENPLWGELIDCSSSSKQSKIIFFIKLLSLVSRIIDIRLDIYIAPHMLLCGQDVSSAHLLLQALATASMASAEVISQAVKSVTVAGDENLYSIGVKTRKSFTSLQALFRGWLVRRDMQLVQDAAALTVEQHMSAEREYEALLLRKSQVAEEILEAENRLKKENGKLIRILKLQANAKSRTNTSYPRHQRQYSRPQTAPSLDDTKFNLPVSFADEEFAESVIDMRGLQLRLKQKEKLFHEREQQLNVKRRASKQKAVELALQEERITELADKIRKQHHKMKVKEQKLRFEKIKEKRIHPTPPETAAHIEQAERKLDTTRIEAKLRQRVRYLNNREANILRMAKKLRNRELLLAKREDKISAEIDEYEKVKSTSTKKHHTSLKRRRSIRDSHDDENDVSVSSHEGSMQCSAIEEEDEEEDTSSAGDGGTPRPLSASNDEPTTMPPPSHTSNDDLPNDTTPGTKSLNHHPPTHDEEDITSQSLHKRVTLPSQHSHYSNHVFTFEKTDLDHVNDLGDHDDAQLRCAVNNLRELL
eukprot:scaffold10624_cov104-Skeletonema_dohrnii-CCMP3373.AAC.3